jgi:hypothetical protein
MYHVDKAQLFATHLPADFVEVVTYADHCREMRWAMEKLKQSIFDATLATPSVGNVQNAIEFTIANPDWQRAQAWLAAHPQAKEGRDE